MCKFCFRKRDFFFQRIILCFLALKKHFFSSEKDNALSNEQMNRGFRRIEKWFGPFSNLVCFTLSDKAKTFIGGRKLRSQFEYKLRGLRKVGHIHEVPVWCPNFLHSQFVPVIIFSLMCACIFCLPCIFYFFFYVSFGCYRLVYLSILFVFSFGFPIPI